METLAGERGGSQTARESVCVTEMARVCVCVCVDLCTRSRLHTKVLVMKYLISPSIHTTHWASACIQRGMSFESLHARGD